MKTFIGACITLIATVVCSVILAIYTASSAGRMLSLTDELYTANDSDRGKAAVALEKLGDEWERSKTVMNLTVSHTETYAIDLELCQLEESAESGNDEEYALALVRLRLILTKLMKSERFSLDWLF